jgi:hypothetical protein
MTDVVRVFFCPIAELELVRKVVQVLGGIHAGMFLSTKPVPGSDNVLQISSGKINAEADIFKPQAELSVILAGASVTESEIKRFVEIIDITESDPDTRARQLDAELNRTQNAAPWEDGKAYPLDAFARHNGFVWRNMVEGNTFAPGVFGWRIVWGATTEGDPPWTPPAAREDAYMEGERVEVDGIGYTSDINYNTTRPGTLGAAWTPDSVPLDRWNRPGTVIPGSSPPAVYPAYDQDINFGGTTSVEVIWDNPADGGADWVFQSKIANNAAAEPGRDEPFNRYWEPKEPA